MNQKKHSLKKRYIYKIATNIFGMLLGFVTTGIIPRGLGPIAYGQMTFLTNWFTQIINFFDMGTSSAFYTKLSQRQKEKPLVRFYLYFIFIVLFILFLFILLAFAFNLSNILWPDQKMRFIIMSAILAAFLWISQIVFQISDAYGLTVYSEVIRMGQKALWTIIVLLLFYTSSLTLFNYFNCQYIVLIIIIIILHLMFIKKDIKIFNTLLVEKTNIYIYIKEFYKYSHPLFLYALVGMFVGIIDRWLLQIYSGSLQQGYYGLSYNIGALCFIFTTAMIPLLLREFSINYIENNINRMRELFRKYIPVLYSLTTYFSCFLCLQADKVVVILGGKVYSGAIVTVALMSLYPIHQTYGQSTSTVLLASGQTKIFRNIGISFMLLGLPITYYILAPLAQGGFNGGAQGLALKMIIIQFFAVNFQLYYVCKYLNSSFIKYLFHQVSNFIFMLIVSGISVYFIDMTFSKSLNLYIRFVISGIIYTGIVIFSLIKYPIIIGIDKNDKNSILKRFQKILLRK